MNGAIWTMGELLVEIMRPRAGMSLYEAGEFLGPYASGAPGIFIDTAARLKHKTGIISGVGNDDFGRMITDRLERDGVNCRLVNRSDTGSTGCAFVTYYDDGSREFIFHIGNTPPAEAKAPTEEELDAALGASKPSYFHVMGCSLMSSPQFCQEIIKTMELFYNRGAQISFDPNIRPELLKGRPVSEVTGPVMEKCSVLMPGVDELRLLSGRDGVEDGVAYMFDAFHSLKLIVLKRGSKGSAVFTPSGEGYDFGVYSVEVKDPTGAGDCFDAAFLCGLNEGMSISETIRFASSAAALNTAAFGPMEGDISRANCLSITSEIL